MSDSCRCDSCKKVGRRPRMRFAPEGWLYLEATAGDDPSDTIIVWACSAACAMAQWKPSPGPRLDGAGESPKA